jgi:CheY-like chemotaxis protein
MNAILGMTELALDSDLDPHQREYLEIVQSSANSLLDVINDILDYSKIEAGKLDIDPIDFAPHELLDATLKPFSGRAEAKDLELAYNIHESVPEWVRADAARLRQILVNLVGNALKFTHHGEVVVDLDVDPDAPGTLHFVVRDTGIGIAPHQQKLVFDTFAQADASTSRQYGGTGLGLAISSQLVGLMRGRIWLESRLGHGSAFHFTIACEPALAPPRAAHHDLQHLVDARVLVVDDNATNRQILETTLQRFGLRPVLADSGEAALSRLEEARGRGERFDYVLLDVHMPGMDGYALAEHLRNDTDCDSSLLLMLSSSPSPFDAKRCRELGISAHLTKPVSRDGLIEAILRARAEETDHRPAARKAVQARRDEASGRSLKILLAEDNRVNQTLAVRLLEKLGHTVEVVDDGQKDVSAVVGGSFDLVLMDVQMPGMDGLEATVLIRQLEDSSWATPIVALTAHAMKGDEARCREAGMDAYLTKPLQSATLDRTLRELVG